MKSVIYYFGLLLVAGWLFVLHSSFAYSMNPIFLATDFFNDLFALQNGYDLKIYFPYVFGLVFSVAITAIMAILERGDKYFWTFAIIVASLELFGLTLLCWPGHEDTWVMVSAIYYGVYSFFVIIFYFYIKPATKLHNVAQPLQKSATIKHTGVPDGIEKQVMDEINRSTFSQAAIAKMFGLEPYQVTRIKQKYQ